ncbi:hypothetical protein MNV49_002658 [Pseudohyphozyma bogoriensis]|nr:hypothetical protein MNV49_002658 [Pseudohyphozyma bogoriensis]
MRLNPHRFCLWSLVWSTWFRRAHAQFCAVGTGTLTNEGGAYYCCTTINAAVDSTNAATGADSCSRTFDAGTATSTYSCSYTTNTDLTARTYDFPPTVTALELEVVGGNGESVGASLGGLGQVVTGTLTDTSDFINGQGYVFVGAGGGTGTAVDGAGGGFSSFGFNDQYATTDAAVQGPADGRVVVAGGGGGAGDNTAGGNAGYPAGADGEQGFGPDYGEGGTQTTGGAGHSGDVSLIASNGTGMEAEVPASFTATLGDSSTLPHVLVSYLPKRKRELATRQQANLVMNNNPACPPTQRACPLPSGNFECIDFDELTSCGGCVSTGTGVDCLSLPGTNGVGCVQDRCVAFAKEIKSIEIAEAHLYAMLAQVTSDTSIDYLQGIEEWRLYIEDLKAQEEKLRCLESRVKELEDENARKEAKHVALKAAKQKRETETARLQKRGMELGGILDGFAKAKPPKGWKKSIRRVRPSEREAMEA